MKISPIVLKLRLANTRFQNRIGGAAEFGVAYDGTLIDEMAFVIQTSERADANNLDGAVSQRLLETFAAMVAVKNDTRQSDKLGILAFDSLDDTRKEIFQALIGFELPDSEGPIYYKAGRLMRLTPAWLWYMYEFEFPSRIVDGGIQERAVTYDDPTDFESIYINYMAAEDGRLPWDKVLPVDDGFPDVKPPDFAQLIKRE